MRRIKVSSYLVAAFVDGVAPDENTHVTTRGVASIPSPLEAIA